MLQRIHPPKQSTSQFPQPESSWATGYARSGVHVYSVNDDVAMGYRGWRRTTSSKDRFQGATVKRHLKEAMSNNLASQGQAGESSETPAGYYDDGTPYFWSGSSQTY
ncbi:uncharacterized protein G6M90_00g000220 [Metarhizium brunneum]|uniref:Uncharacterized protein n=1 Tax=Metarhizium brunneum TaxID=500148 RepID=A0A7D5UQP9_9HYPO